MGHRPITDFWMLCRGKTGYYGTYPAGFVERARALLGVQLYDPVLHICSGAVMEYQSGPMKCKGVGPNDCTLDLDPALEPDFLLDARRIGVSPGDVFPYWQPIGPDKSEGVNIGMFDCTDGEGAFAYHQGADERRPWPACLIDRPYTDADAEHYGPGAANYPSNPNDLLRRALAITQVGGRVGMIDYYWPRPPKVGVALVAAVAVTVGWGNRVRIFSVYEKTAFNPLEYNVTGDDPRATGKFIATATDLELEGRRRPSTGDEDDDEEEPDVFDVPVEMWVPAEEAPEEPAEIAEEPSASEEGEAPAEDPDAALAALRKRKRRKRAGLA